jgi:hypothetical protein
MSTNRKATMAKRQRELNQKDRVKEREQRRQERRSRIQERVVSGVSGPPIASADLPPARGPVLGVDGPRSLAELRAAQAAASNHEEDAFDRIVDPDEIER